MEVNEKLKKGLPEQTMEGKLWMIMAQLLCWMRMRMLPFTLGFWQIEIENMSVFQMEPVRNRRLGADWNLNESCRSMKSLPIW